MKLASFHLDGVPGYGVVRDGQVLPADNAMRARWPTLRTAIAGNGLPELADLGSGGVPLDQVVLDLPIPDPGKIICVGRNYGEHVREGGREAPDYPMLFARFPSSFVPHGGALVRPFHSDRFDYEGELACIIGRPARHVPELEALSYVAGYTCLNEGSIRDWQRHTGQMMPGKNFWRSGAMGPFLVTADEVPDPATLTLVTWLNGEEVQRSSTGAMIFPIPRIIEYVTSFIDLQPGDVLATGTPSGVALYRSPQRFLEAGDTIEVEIGSVGHLRNTVDDEASKTGGSTPNRSALTR